LWRHLGPGWLAYRTLYAARLHTGWLRRRTPGGGWGEVPLRKLVSDPALADPANYLQYRRRSAPAFFFAPSARGQYLELFSRWDGGAGVSPTALAEEVGRGTLRYFEHTTAPTGFPPDWHRNAFTNQRTPSDRHWSEIGDFSHGDIKVIWEPSRFGFTYALVRAYWRTGDGKYASLFWRLVEDWREKNPPHRGANWKCGQEVSFRVMAWCFGLYGFLEAEATTAERVAMLAQLIAVSARRIEANLGYAVSQRNNHGISEGTGLWTAGALFPELRGAARWRETGRQVLESLGSELIYDDGSFAQHSLNYQRLMLHDYLWSLRLGDLHGQPFSDGLRGRVTAAGAFLYQAQDERSGRVPNYGHNDGALILPLDNCNAQDFRPVVQAVHYLSRGERCYGDGPWDEDLLWLFGDGACGSRVSAPPRRDLRAEAGGYYTLRSSDGFAFTRCAAFRDRPGQADMLHVDLWWRGQNVALDAGTYSYNAPAPWDNALSHTACHNTVTVDGLDQMDRVGKFLWLPWLRARVLHCLRSPCGNFSYWEGEHDGYRRLRQPVGHRRAVTGLWEGCWVVLDALDSNAEHRYRLHWMFGDFPHEWDGSAGSLTLRTPAGAYHVRTGAANRTGAYSLIRADERGPRGWHSAFYLHRGPALSLELEARADSLLFWTVFCAEPPRVALDGSTLRVEAGPWRGDVELAAGAGGRPSLVSRVTVGGASEGRLEIR
jgi:asparagine synthase (glutamine-hydrolysing)